MQPDDPAGERVRELRALAGEAVLTAAPDMAPYLRDQRALYRGRALAVVQPRSVEEVAAVVRWANAQGVGVVPQGGNTGYCGGATPDESGSQVVLSLSRLNRVRTVDAANFSLVAEAGCVLANVQRAAQDADRLFPLSLGSEGSCQIGGNLATNAGGLNVVRYGMTRELVLGVEAVLPDGSVLHDLKSLRKDNTGYDLKSLLIGSEGTLGVITAASLKLWPRDLASATGFAAVQGPRQALSLLGLLRTRAGEWLSSFELLPRIAVDLALRHVAGVAEPLDRPYPWYVLCELTSSAEQDLTARLESALAAAAENALILDASIATSERVRDAFWKLRESVPEAQRRVGASLKHDISVPVAALPRFIEEASDWVRLHVPEAVLVCYGHAGDGNLHFNVNAADAAHSDALRAREPEIRRAVHERVAAFDGSFSAEHGIGQLKREELRRYAPAETLAAMRAIKRALDPNGIMNPGKVL